MKTKPVQYIVRVKFPNCRGRSLWPKVTRAQARNIVARAKGMPAYKGAKFSVVRKGAK